MRRARLLVGWVVVAAALGGCPDKQKMAAERLAAEGYEGAGLEGAEGAGSSYTFTATKDGRACTGTITVTAMPGSSAADFNTEARCKGAESGEAAEERVDPLAGETAACEKGDLKACTQLGRALVDGPLGQRDLERARAVHLKACEAGALKSCNALGTLHLRGLGGPQDEARAEELFTKSCGADDMDGCALLGRLRFINRRGKEARELLKRACDAGSFVGCDGLGAAYRELRRTVHAPFKQPPAPAPHCRWDSRKSLRRSAGRRLRSRRDPSGLRPRSAARHLFACAGPFGLAYDFTARCRPL